MIDYLSRSLTTWLIRNKAIHENEYDLYVFASYNFLLTFAPIFIALLVGIIIGNVISGLEIIIPFIFIRKFSGGFHARRAWVCLIGSILIMSLCILGAQHIKISFILDILTILAAISLSIFSPIDTDNKRLTHNEKLIYKQITILLIALNITLIMICFILNYPTIAKNMEIGIILAACLQIPCLINYNRK